MRVLFLFAFAVVATAAPISSLSSTGSAAPGSNVDAHWTVNGAPAYITATGVFPFPAWAATVPSQWISPRSTYVDRVGDPANTTFVFSTSFTLPSNLDSALIVMRAATDNALTEVRLNGTAVAFSTVSMIIPGGTSPTNVIFDGTGFDVGLGAPLRIDSGFRTGVNTLSLSVRNGFTNAQNTSNPTGLDVGITSDFTTRVVISDVPEPSQIASLAGGFLTLTLLALRRRLSSR